MGVVIDFPNDEQRTEKLLLDSLSQLTFPSDDLRHCVVENVMAVLKKHAKLPPYSFALEFPAGVSEDQATQIAEKVVEESKNYFLPIQRNLVTQICVLYVELCKLSLKRDT